MAGSVAAERHLWLNLTEIREKENVFLLDAPISQTGLFGEAVSSVVEKIRSAKSQSCLGGRGTTLAPPSPPCLENAPCPGKRPPVGAAPRLITLQPQSGEPVADHCPTGDLAGGLI